MPQGTQTAAFTMVEVLRLAMGPIPGPHPEPSLIAAPGLEDITQLESYMDDVFVKHATFQEQWAFIRDHLLPRLLWADRPKDKLSPSTPAHPRRLPYTTTENETAPNDYIQ